MALRADDAGLLRGLASVLYELAAWSEAEPLMRRALEILESSLGSNHPNTMKARVNLRALGDLEPDPC